MNKYAELYDNLATLIAYPQPGYHQHITACQALVNTECPDLSCAWDAFAMFASRFPVSSLEEFYTKTFDFDPDCALEIGWHLYGENYGRGDFLVKMRHLLRHCGLREWVELPDHLTYVLAALGRLQEQEAHSFARDYVIPAMNKLMNGVSQKDTPYRSLLQLIHHVLSKCYTYQDGGRAYA